MLWIALSAAIGGGRGLTAQGDVPPAPRRMVVDGAELPYVDQGTGAPVLFVHGVFSDLRFWEPQRAAIAARHRFLAYTLRYHGTAPWGDAGERYSAATHAADLATLVRRLDAGPVHLVGLSFGGLVALLVASEHPDLVRSLTLAEPTVASLLAESAEGRSLAEQRVRSMTPIRAAVQAGDTARATAMFVDWVENASVGAFASEPEALRTMALENARTIPLTLAAPPPPPLSCAALGRMKVPTLVVAGARTRRYFEAISEAVAHCIPGSRLTSIHGATHLVSQHDAAAFNDALVRFVDEH